MVGGGRTVAAGRRTVGTAMGIAGRGIELHRVSTRAGRASAHLEMDGKERGGHGRGRKRGGGGGLAASGRGGGPGAERGGGGNENTDAIDEGAFRFGNAIRRGGDTGF